MTTQLLATQKTRSSTFNLLQGIWAHLNGLRRIQVRLLFVVMLASGAAELVSLGSVLPFLAVLSDPELLWQQPIVRNLAASHGLVEPSKLLLPATLLFASAAVLAAVIRLTNLWLNGRLAAAVGSDLSCDAYRRTLYQPYGVHVQRNSAEVINRTTTQISQTVAALNALLQLVTAAVVAASLLTGLLLIDAPLAIAAGGLFGSAYGLLAITARRQLSRNGQKIVQASNQQLKALQEGLGAIRDVLLDGSQPIYIQIYQKADRLQRQLGAKNNFLGGFPRFALEAFGLTAIALLGFLLVVERGSGLTIIPLLGAMAVGAQRLLPAFQQIYGGWATLRGNHAAIEGVLAMLDQALPKVVGVAEPMHLRSSICLENLHFSYGTQQSDVLNGLNLEILKGDRIGLIGSTGSGKSTTVDLLMGLLAPTSGRILVDGADLHDPTDSSVLVKWRAAIAHVPQNIYLADCSIAENIAFGIPRQHIDFVRVKRAAAQAQIASFIESNPEGYESFVGERGIRLSGGQRQRIGIARALYRQASVIVLDEATSALDTRTEEAVMDAIEGLSRDLTLVMIAHRLSTIQRCDRVIRLDQGIILADGPPSQVLSPFP